MSILSWLTSSDPQPYAGRESASDRRARVTTERETRDRAARRAGHRRSAVAADRAGWAAIDAQPSSRSITAWFRR